MSYFGIDKCYLKNKKDKLVESHDHPQCERQKMIVGIHLFLDVLRHRRCGWYN